MTNSDTAHNLYYDIEHVVQDFTNALTSLDPAQTNTMDNVHTGKYVPHPGQLSEFIITTKSGLVTSSVYLPEIGTLKPWSGHPDQAGDPKVINTQGGNNMVFKVPTWDPTGKVADAHYVFYTPDMLVDAPLVASTFNNSKKGLMLNDTAIRMGAILDATKTYNPASLYNTGYYNNKVLEVLEMNNFSITNSAKLISYKSILIFIYILKIIVRYILRITKCI